MIYIALKSWEESGRKLVGAMIAAILKDCIESTETAGAAILQAKFCVCFPKNTKIKKKTTCTFASHATFELQAFVHSEKLHW